MISENIKNARKKKGLSQEELATELHEVRQTVSKWETGASVPDATMLLLLAKLLETPPELLLGINTQKQVPSNLDPELSRLKAELADLTEKEALRKQAVKKREIILFLSFLAMAISLAVKNEVVSVLLAGGCILTATAVLYRNLPQLTSLPAEPAKLSLLKVTTLFHALLLALTIAIVLLDKTALTFLTEGTEKWLAAALISAVMLFGGIVSPKLPFNRHTGLRLPWTVQDEETWHIAHKVLGYLSLPLVLLFWALTCTVENFEAVSLLTLLLWIGVPGGISLVFFLKKWHNNR